MFETNPIKMIAKGSLNIINESLPCVIPQHEKQAIIDFACIIFNQMCNEVSHAIILRFWGQ